MPVTAEFLARYIGTAALGAAGLAFALSGALRLVRGRPEPRLLPLAFWVLFFGLLAFHPFPAPGSLHCPVPFAKPQLTPFAFLHRLAHAHGETGSLAHTLLEADALAAAMNLLVCIPIGMALVPFGIRPPTGLALGFLLSFAIETAQLTGLFGFYPCAYRQFDVDDLLLNSLGVWAGTCIACRRAARRAGP
jgi:hypothetical protein